MGKQLAIRSLVVGIAGVLLTLVISASFGPNSAQHIETRVETAANGALTQLGLVEWRATAGFAPSRASLAAIHNAGRKLYGSDMSNMMTLASGAPAGVEWDVAVIAALEALVKLKRGSAQLSGGKLVVMGLTENETDAEIIRMTLLHADTGVTTIAEVLGPPDWIASVERGRITFPCPLRPW
jgi:hypothetical protein